MAEQILTQATPGALAAPVGLTDSAITVANAALFSPIPQFRVAIDSELMLVTNVAGAVFTVTRGIEGTVAATHANAAPVQQTFTAGSVFAILRQRNASPLTTSGSLTVNLTDTYSEYRCAPSAAGTVTFVLPGTGLTTGDLGGVVFTIEQPGTMVLAPAAGKQIVNPETGEAGATFSWTITSPSQAAAFTFAWDSDVNAYTPVA